MTNTLSVMMGLIGLTKNRCLFISFVAILFYIPASVFSSNKQPEMSFNCAEIFGGIAKVICDSRELSQLDSAMVEVYKVAKEINPSIKHEQYLWLKQRNKCSGEKQPACLKKSYLSRARALQLAIERGVKVPDGWENFYLSGWIKVVNKICTTDRFDEVEQHDRLVNRIRLNKTSELLVLGCSFAANQDGHLVYLLARYKEGVYAKQVTFFRPFYHKGWKMMSVEKMNGPVTLYKKDQTFGVLRRYTQKGTCGYSVSYNVSDLYRSEPLEPLKPVKLKAEYDCDRGTGYNNWPDITLPLPLSSEINLKSW